MGEKKIPSLKQKTTVKDQVYTIIKDMILSQEYQLGEKISIDTLAEAMNISNSPIREALTMLEKRGLVQSIPNAGFHVVSFSAETFREICMSLYVIVSGAFDLCLEQNTINNAATQMHQILELQKENLDDTEMHTSVKYALSFDKCLVQATGNHYLLSIYEQIEDLFYLMALHSHQRNAAEHKQNVYEHLKILENIDNSNAQEVKRWLYSHYNKHA